MTNHYFFKKMCWSISIKLSIRIVLQYTPTASQQFLIHLKMCIVFYLHRIICIVYCTIHTTMEKTHKNISSGQNKMHEPQHKPKEVQRSKFSYFYCRQKQSKNNCKGLAYLSNLNLRLKFPSSNTGCGKYRSSIGISVRG